MEVRCPEMGQSSMIQKLAKPIMRMNSKTFFKSTFLAVFILLPSVGYSCGSGDLSPHSDIYFYGSGGIMACINKLTKCSNVSTGKASAYTFAYPLISKDCTFTVTLGLTDSPDTYGSGQIKLTGTIAKDKLNGSGYFTSGKYGGIFTMIRR